MCWPGYGCHWDFRLQFLTSGGFAPQEILDLLETLSCHKEWAASDILIDIGQLPPPPPAKDCSVSMTKCK